ncbi:MAG: rhomboid family intramembrane serine protease [Perlabentimonas sp.]
MKNVDSKIFKHSLILPSVFILILWLIAISEYVLNANFHFLGINPRTISGLIGIVLSPFIHGDFNHLLSNSVPLLVMGTGIIYFYRSLSYKVFLIIWLVSGACVWLAGRPSYHIGASGIVYGLAAFLFFSGVIRRDTRLAAISLVVVFLYGSMIWGVFPFWPSVSWEGHLFGGISGAICAVAFKDNGPKRKVYLWEMEDEEEDNDNNQDNSTNTLNTDIQIHNVK